MTEQKPLAAELAAILELPPDAGDGEIVDRVRTWASERKQLESTAAFERRISELVRVTNMPREHAAETLRAQDAAALVTAKNA